MEFAPRDQRHFYGGGKIGVAGIPFERSDVGRVGTEAKIRRTHPGEGAVVQQLGIDQAEQEASVVARVEIGIIHLEPGIAGGEIKRDGLVVPKEATVAEFEAIDGKREELFDRSLAGDGSRSPRKICGAVGIESEMDDGLIENEFLES